MPPARAEALHATGRQPRALDGASTALAHQLPRAAGNALRQIRPLLLGKHVLVRTDNTAAVSYINRMGGIRSRRMSQLACHLLLWGHTRLKSLRAVHEKQVLLVAPFWPTLTWFPELILLATAPPWRIPLRKDLLSQGLGTIWHPRPDLWNLHVWLLDGTQQT